MASAIEAWNDQVTRHHEQSERIQQENFWSQRDFWKDIAAQFQSDPDRTADPVLERLLRDVTPETTILDVGGGAGRYALPLARRARHVTVVEPSASMLARLEDAAHEASISNISVLAEKWEDVEAPIAHLVLCAHVVYGTADIEPFVSKLTDHATQRVLLLAFLETPLTQFSPFWPLVHSETRINLPALPELLPVLWETGTYPNLEMFPPIGVEMSPDVATARALLRHFLFVLPESEQDGRLQAAMDDLLVESAGGLTIRGSRSRRQALVSWVG
jgi:SAM-dependent methyltransferase